MATKQGVLVLVRLLPRQLATVVAKHDIQFTTSNSYEMNNRVKKTHSTHRMICNDHMDGTEKKRE